MKQKKCNCEEEETDNTMNYLLLGGIVIIWHPNCLASK